MEDDLSSIFGIPLGLSAAVSAPSTAATATAPAADGSTVVPAGSAHPVPAPSSDHYVEQDGKHKGFAGVARDILGTLGDFLLTRLHMPAMYAPAQKERKMEAAMHGFDQDPLGAINRVTSVDYTAGSKLRDQFIDNQRMAAQQASTQEARESRLALARQAVDERTRSRVGAMLNTMSNWDDTKRQSNYGALRDQVLRYAKTNNLDLSSELPENYDPNALDAFIDTSVPVGTQRAQRLTSERTDVMKDLGTQRIDTTRRGQDIGRDVAVMRDGTTRRGQDISRENNVDNNETRVRGQDIRSGDTRRGQDIRQTTAGMRDATTRRGQDIRAKPHTPQEGERRTIGGKTYVWRNGKAVLQ